MSAAGCGGGGGASEAAKVGDLVVRVADARQPSVSLQGAVVTVTAGSVTKTATTPVDGVVTFRNLPAGTANVSVELNLFRPYTLTGTVQGAAPVGLTALLQRRTGHVSVTSVDTFGTPVPNVQVQTTVEGQAFAATTNATGTAVLANVPTASAAIAVTANGFLPEASQTVTVVESPVVETTFELDRRTESAGGVVVVRPRPPVDAGQTLTFTVRTIVVDAQARAIETLQAADFVLSACTDADPARVECIRDPSNAAFDAPYTVVGTGPDALVKVPGQAAVPYAAAISFDESGSISGNDPTDARVFAGKTFLQGVGGSNRVSLAAFAEGADARIATTPLTTFGGFTADGTSFFDAIDQFGTLEGGGTPLYDALDRLLQFTAQNAPAGVPGQRRAVVLFTDGFDTVCAQPAACRQASVDLSRTLGVDVFTVGLGGGVDNEALSELAYRANGAHLVAANPEQLVAIYGSLGDLLGGAISTYETTWTIRAAASGVFVSGRAVFGTLRVNAGGQALQLPFLYTIP